MLAYALNAIKEATYNFSNFDCFKISVARINKFWYNSCQILIIRKLHSWQNWHWILWSPSTLQVHNLICQGKHSARKARQSMQILNRWHNLLLPYFWVVMRFCLKDDSVEHIPWKYTFLLNTDFKIMKGVGARKNFEKKKNSSSKIVKKIFPPKIKVYILLQKM